MSFLLAWILIGLLNASLASSNAVPFLTQSFFFDWTPEGQVPPIPVTEQCQPIHIKWLRSAATGPNPSPPYFLQVYSSSYTTPFIISAGNNLSFDWPVPFPPGSQYQICMFDTNGNTGGCQAIYTMIPSSTNATCANMTAPPTLDAQGFVINGPWSQYGWIDQCTDLSVVPKNGTPPYTLTIAPSLHPPYNITSNTNHPLNWTVSLSWATPFFVSVVDGTGQLWSSGPLHSGGGPFSSTGCLSGQDVDKSLIKPYVAIASGGGGLLFGLFVGAVVAWCFLRKAKKLQGSDSALFLRDSPNFGDAMVRPAQYSVHEQYRPIPTTSSSGVSNSPPHNRLGYQVEPFRMPDEEGRVYSGLASQSHASAYMTGSSGAQHHLTYDREPSSPTSLQPQHSVLQPSQPTIPAPSQVYVVHHDSEAPPVTIYHQQGTQVVELPPRYPPNSSHMLSSPISPDDLNLQEGRSTSNSEGRTETTRSLTQNNTLSLHQQRQVGPIRKLVNPE